METKQAQLEKVKLSTDFLKHLTTLSTGSIVILTTFLQKVVSQATGKAYVVASLVSFLLAVVCCVISFISLVFDLDLGDHPEARFQWTGGLGVLGLLAALASFFFGVLFLAVFAVRNL